MTALHTEEGRYEALTHIFVCLLVIVGSAMAALRPGWLRTISLGCALRTVTGIRCPFCGMTTDFMAMWKGSMPHENPFSILAAVVIYLLYPTLLMYTFRTNQLYVFSDRRLQSCVLCLVLVMWAANNFLR